MIGNAGDYRAIEGNGNIGQNLETMQIINGVYQANGIAYGYKQNSYVVKVGDSQILIDSGDLWFRDPPGAFETVLSNCRYWGIQVETLSHLLVTHAHFDHSSHAARWQSMGLKILCSEDTAQAMDSGDERCIGYAVNRRFEPCRADVVVGDEQEIDIEGIGVRCIAAPGHARGCMIYEVTLDERVVWFVGDVVVIGEDPSHGGPWARSGFPAALILTRMPLWRP